MALSFANSITAIRTATRLDVVSPSPVTDAQITVWLDSELSRLRGLINDVAPNAYATVTGTLTIAAGAQTLNKPNDFERLIRIETLIGGRWVNLEPADDVNAEVGPLGFEEVAATFLVWPSLRAPGSYRIRYSSAHAAGQMDAPDGLEDVAIERVCARVKERLLPDEAPMHFQIADRIWTEQRTQLSRRWGRNNRAGFTPTYRSGRMTGATTR